MNFIVKLDNEKKSCVYGRGFVELLLNLSFDIIVREFREFFLHSLIHENE